MNNLLKKLIKINAKSGTQLLIFGRNRENLYGFSEIAVPSMDIGIPIRERIMIPEMAENTSRMLHNKKVVSVNIDIQTKVVFHILFQVRELIGMRKYVAKVKPI